jgi:PIN domain nuclease of toxin-antitoxin system
MTVFVLDSSALIRFFDSEPGAARVEAILIDGVAGSGRVVMSAVQWGEFAGNMRKRFGAAREVAVLASPATSDVEIIPATAERAVRAAELKIDHGISYADAFAIELAMDTPDHVLVTADFGFKAVDDLAKIEFLPPK